MDMKGVSRVQLVILLIVCPLTQAVNSKHENGVFIVSFIQNRRLTTTPVCRIYLTPRHDYPVNVSVTTPLYGTEYDSSFVLEPQKTRVLQYDFDYSMVGSILRRKISTAIVIRAGGDISVHAASVNRLSTDAFRVWPLAHLGYVHYAMCYIYTEATELIEGPTEFGVVATKNNTNVTVILPALRPEVYDVVGIQRRGRAMTFQMDAYETFQLQGKGVADLTGTRITSTEPVAFFSGTRWTSVSVEKMGDHIVEQIAPVTTWGRSFLTLPIATRSSGDLFRVLAHQNHTVVWIHHNGSYTNLLQLNAAQFTDVEASSTDSVYIVSNKPLYVVHLCKSSQADPGLASDPFMTAVPPLEQYSISPHVFSTIKSNDFELGEYSDDGEYENYANVIMASDDFDGLRLNGNPIPPDAIYQSWPVVGKTGYSGLIVLLTPGTHVLAHRNASVAMSVSIYGHRQQESYGFMTGQNSDIINPVCVPSYAYEGDGIDNDCDDLVDEELPNGKDDDGDDLIDEDIASNDTKSTVFPSSTLVIESTTVSSFSSIFSSMYTAVSTFYSSFIESSTMSEDMTTILSIEPTSSIKTSYESTEMPPTSLPISISTEIELFSSPSMEISSDITTSFSMFSSTPLTSYFIESSFSMFSSTPLPSYFVESSFSSDINILSWSSFVEPTSDILLVTSLEASSDISSEISSEISSDMSSYMSSDTLLPISSDISISTSLDISSYMSSPVSSDILSSYISSYMSSAESSEISTYISSVSVDISSTISSPMSSEIVTSISSDVSFISSEVPSRMSSDISTFISSSMSSYLTSIEISSDFLSYYSSPSISSFSTPELSSTSPLLLSSPTLSIFYSSPSSLFAVPESSYISCLSPYSSSSYSSFSIPSSTPSSAYSSVPFSSASSTHSSDPTSISSRVSSNDTLSSSFTTSVLPSSTFIAISTTQVSAKQTIMLSPSPSEKEPRTLSDVFSTSYITFEAISSIVAPTPTTVIDADSTVIKIRINFWDDHILMLIIPAVILLLVPLLCCLCVAFRSALTKQQQTQAVILPLVTVEPPRPSPPVVVGCHTFVSDAVRSLKAQHDIHTTQANHRAYHSTDILL